MSANLLVELFVEELPPKALKKLGEAFGNLRHQSLVASDLIAPSEALRLGQVLPWAPCASPRRGFQDSAKRSSASAQWITCHQVSSVSRRRFSCLR